MKIKICGITSTQDLRAINEFKPDYIGFIFAPSKRRIALADAVTIKAELAADVATVGVFVNADLDFVAAAADSAIDFIQLHGDETSEYINSLKSLTDKPIIKAVRVKSTAQILAADELSCDYLLLDTFHENSYGGVGKTFDYTLIPATKHKIFLAGGLNINNIDSAISANPFALDINSGVEIDGVKNYDKIKNIILHCRHTLAAAKKEK